MLVKVVILGIVFINLVNGFGSEKEYPSDHATIAKKCDYVCKQGLNSLMSMNFHRLFFDPRCM